VAFYNSQNIVLGKGLVDALLSCLATRPMLALIVAGKIRLSSDPAFAPSPNSAISDFTAGEATFSGYPAGGIAAVLSGVVNQSPNLQSVTAPALFIESSPATITNQIYGYWMDDGTLVDVAEVFVGGPFPFSKPGDFLDLVVSISAAMLVQILG
jgi:hypothetical protein